MNGRDVFDELRLAASASQVDDAWAKLDGLMPVERMAVIDTIEKVFIEELSDIAADYAPLWPRMQARLDDVPDDAEKARMIDHYQGIGQIFLHVREEKGDKAHQMTQEYAYRAFQLSQFDYYSLKGQIGLMVEVYNAFSMPPKGNAPETPLARDFPPAAGNQPKALPPGPSAKKKGRKFDL